MPVSRRPFLRLGGSLLLAGPLARTSGDPPDRVRGVRLGHTTESRIRLYSRRHPEGREIAFKCRDDVVTIVWEVGGPLARTRRRTPGSPRPASGVGTAPTTKLPGPHPDLGMRPRMAARGAAYRKASDERA